MRYQNHLTQFVFLPQLLQKLEQICTQRVFFDPDCMTIKNRCEPCASVGSPCALETPLRERIEQTRRIAERFNSQSHQTQLEALLEELKQASADQSKCCGWRPKPVDPNPGNVKPQNIKGKRRGEQSTARPVKTIVRKDKTWLIVARGNTIDRAKQATHQYAIEEKHFNRILEQLPILLHSSQTRANLMQMVGRVIAAIQRMVRADSASGLFGHIKDRKGLFALVGLHTDGSERQYNRLKAFMGKHVENKSLGERLEHVIDLLCHLHSVTYDEKRNKLKFKGALLSIEAQSASLAGADLNANNPEGMHNVRGGQWKVARLNPDLFGKGNNFIRLDERCFALRDDAAFNTFVNITAQRHFDRNKSQGLTVRLFAQELLERSGLAQLTQGYVPKIHKSRRAYKKYVEGTWRERKTLRRVLETLVGAGLIAHYEFRETKNKPDLHISFPD